MIPERIFKSPNCRPRKTPIIGIVDHITVGDAKSVLQTFLNPATEVAAHFLITRTPAKLIQFVDPSLAAYGSGIIYKPTARLVLERLPNILSGKYGANDLFIQIEHEGKPYEDLDPDQYRLSIELHDELTKVYDISLDRIHLIRHQEIRASKTCPGVMDVNKIIKGVLERRSPGVQIAPLSPTPADTLSQLNFIQLQIIKLQEILSNLRNIKKLGAVLSISEKD